MLVHRNQLNAASQPFEAAHPKSSNKKRRRKSSCSTLSSFASNLYAVDENSEWNTVSVQDVIDNLSDLNHEDNPCTKDEDTVEEIKEHIVFPSCLKTEPVKNSGGVSLKGRKRGNPGWQNQDTFGMKVFNDVKADSSRSVYFVCDGHGKDGHLVSAQCRQWLPDILFQHTGFDQKRALSLLHKALILCPSIDTDCSGCTCITAIIHDKKIIEVGNLGDSRCILIRSKSDGQLEHIPLSIDHKPSRANEKKRIIQAGGRVGPRQDCGPTRVWFRYNQSTLGLAMSRSLGDEMAHKIGVSCEPELYRHEITPNDKFLVIATDGLWDVLTNDQVSKLIHIYLSHFDDSCPKRIATFLVQTARSRWESFCSENIDDITCLVIAIKESVLE